MARQPTRGSTKGIIARSIEFCRGLDPSFGEGLRGAKSADIEKIEAAMGRSLSPTYREFLDLMGDGTGKLDLGQYSAHASVLLAMRPATFARLPPNVELFAMPLGDDIQDAFLVPGEGGDLRVMRHDPIEDPSGKGFDLTQADAHAGGLAELICLAQLSRVALAQRHHVVLHDEKPRKGLLSRGRAMLEKHGVEAYPWSNQWTFVGKAGELIAFAKQAPTWPLSMGMAGPDGAKIAELANAVQRELGLVRRQW